MTDLTIRPTGAGNSTNLTPNTGANWECIDESTPDEDSTYVENGDSGYATDTYQTADHTTETGTITNVRIYCRVKIGSIGGDGQIVVRSGGTDYATDIAPTTSYDDYYKDYTDNPADSAAWEWSDIAALEVGVNLSGGTGSSRYARCTQVWAVVTYSIVSTPKGMADSGSGADVFTKAVTQQAKSVADSGSGSEIMSIPFKELPVADSGSGTDVLTNPYRAIVFVETGSGVDVFVAVPDTIPKAVIDSGVGVDAFTLTRILDFIDSGSGVDVFGLLRPKSFTDSGTGVDVISIDYKEMKVTDSGSGVDVFTVPWKGIAKEVVDSGVGSDVFETLFREMEFVETATGTDVFTLLRDLGITDAGSGADVFITPYREMEFIDTGLGTEVMYLTRFLDFIDVGISVDVFSKIELGAKEGVLIVTTMT